MSIPSNSSSSSSLSQKGTDSQLLSLQPKKTQKTSIESYLGFHLGAMMFTVGLSVAPFEVIVAGGVILAGVVYFI